MLKKICVWVFLVLFGSFTIGVYNVEAKEIETEGVFEPLDTTSKLIEKAKSRQAKVTDFESLLKTEGLNREEIYNIGYYYSGDDGEIKFQIKRNKDKTKEEKVTKLISKLQDKYGKSNVVLEYVTYSYEELDGIFDKVVNSVREMKIDNSTNPFKIRLKEIDNKVELEIKSISDVQINELKKQYGDVLIITQNPELDFPVLQKARDTDWNSLGAGIGILTVRGGTCTAAGVAYKGGNYFLMTAGHCLSSYKNGIIEGSGGTEKQFSSVLGVDHLNSFASGYDFGLIRVTDSSPITRNASNGYLKGNLSLPGYDATLKGDTAGFAVNDTVCHSGFWSNYSCGKVTTTKLTYNIQGQVLTGAHVQSLSDLSRGGDSGGPWVDVNNNLIGIHSAAPSAISTHAYFTRWTDVSSKYGLSLYTSNTPTTIVKK